MWVDCFRGFIFRAKTTANSGVSYATPEHLQGKATDKITKFPSKKSQNNTVKDELAPEKAEAVQEPASRTSCVIL